MNRRLAVRMQRTGECRGKAGQSGELRAGGPRARIAPSRMAPMDGAAPWMHPHGRTDGAIQGINLIWEVPGNQPNPEQHMMQERIMAPAEMTASRYISQPRLLMVRASRGQAKAAVAAGTVVSARNDSRQERGSGQPGGSSQYQTQYQTQYQSYPPVYQEKNNMATASLVMGILSLCSICCCMLFGIVFGVLGIIFAIMSKKGDRMDGQAKAGLILSIIGIAVTVLVIIFFVAIEVFAVIPELN